MKRTIVLLTVACLLMACEAHSSAPPVEQKAHAPSRSQAPVAIPASSRQAATLDNSDCMTTGSMEERIVCVGNSSKQSIQNFDGMSGGRASKYLELGKTERALEASEQALVAAEKKQNKGSEDDQPGYLVQLSKASNETFKAWRAYRNAACNANAYYDGLTASSMEDPIIACRIDETKKRIAELEAAVKRLGRH